MRQHIRALYPLRMCSVWCCFLFYSVCSLYINFVLFFLYCQQELFRYQSHQNYKITQSVQNITSIINYFSFFFKVTILCLVSGPILKFIRLCTKLFGYCHFFSKPNLKHKPLYQMVFNETNSSQVCSNFLLTVHSQ